MCWSSCPGCFARFPADEKIYAQFFNDKAQLHRYNTVQVPARFTTHVTTCITQNLHGRMTCYHSSPYPDSRSFTTVAEFNTFPSLESVKTCSSLSLGLSCPGVPLALLGFGSTIEASPALRVELDPHPMSSTFEVRGLSLIH